MNAHLETGCIVLMLWCLWKRCNEKIWKDEEKQPIVSIHQTRELFCQWQQVRAGAD
ncbi:hypothetical protein A2U01_0057643, partial [Trifolium medium]|nr:hypothetical protein [Trifolium medium]